MWVHDYYLMLLPAMLRERRSVSQSVVHNTFSQSLSQSVAHNAHRDGIGSLARVHTIGAVAHIFDRERRPTLAMADIDAALLQIEDDG